MRASLALLALLACAAMCSASLDCNLCIEGIELVGWAIRSNASEQAFFDVMTKFCIDRKIDEPDVCTGAVQTYGPEIVYIATQLEAPQSLCALIGLCNATSLGLPTPVLPRASSALPHAVAVSKPKDGAAVNRGFMFHVSDIHIDVRYTVGTNTSCNRPMCCRPQYGEGTAALYGDYACDTPIILFDKLLEAMLAVNSTPDYVLFTGDSPPHNVWNQSAAYNMNTTDLVMRKLLGAFPNIPILYSIGNHEFYPASQDPFPPADNWVFKEISNFFESQLSPAALETFLKMGFYSRELSPSLLFVALNTQTLDNENFWLALEDLANYDPGSQLEWLNNTLSLAASKGQNVWLASHVPMGDVGILDSYTDRINAMRRKYKNVVASFHGHTHYDQFRVLVDHEGTPYGTQFVLPSVTPVGNRNPTFRVVHFDRDTGDVLDYDQYYANLSLTSNTVAPLFEILYTASQEWQMPDLSPTSFASLWARMAEQPDLLYRYCELFFTSGPGWRATCTPDFLSELLCRSGTSSSLQIPPCMAAHRGGKLPQV